MPRINFRGQTIEVPEQVSGQDLKDLLGIEGNQIPVRVKKNGDYEPINEQSEYRIEDDTRYDRLNRLENG